MFSITARDAALFVIVVSEFLSYSNMHTLSVILIINNSSSRNFDPVNPGHIFT